MPAGPGVIRLETCVRRQEFDATKRETLIFRVIREVRKRMSTESQTHFQTNT